MAMKKLERSDTNKMLAGVCGGAAEYFNLDPTIVRVIWVVLVPLTSGIAALVYAILWLVLPERGTSEIGLDKAVDFYLAHRNRSGVRETGDADARPQP
ncbi:MAG: PspC domain-containing protein [Actinomycetia bacterium]|nr:PspC domain-containing protein [Actinomycetes bacterium]